MKFSAMYLFFAMMSLGSYGCGKATDEKQDTAPGEELTSTLGDEFMPNAAFIDFSRLMPKPDNSGLNLNVGVNLDTERLLQWQSF